MARLLIVGGGCRGLELARELVAEGHAVRMTTRDPANRERIEAAGAECLIADPDRIGTLRYAVEHVTVLAWLLGTASGGNVTELHGSRWEMMLLRAVDTTVRGLLYEAAGSAPPEALAEGRRLAEQAASTHAIPLHVLTEDPADRPAWLAAARRGIGALLGT